MRSPKETVENFHATYWQILVLNSTSVVWNVRHLVTGKILVRINCLCERHSCYLAVNDAPANGEERTRLITCSWGWEIRWHNAAAPSAFRLWPVQLFSGSWECAGLYARTGVRGRRGSQPTLRGDGPFSFLQSKSNISDEVQALLTLVLTLSQKCISGENKA